MKSLIQDLSESAYPIRGMKSLLKKYKITGALARKIEGEIRADNSDSNHPDNRSRKFQDLLKDKLTVEEIKQLWSAAWDLDAKAYRKSLQGRGRREQDWRNVRYG